MITLLNQLEHRFVILLNESPVSPTTFLALVFGALFGAYYYYKSRYGFWQDRGVQGPRPWPLVGNALHMLLGNRLEVSRKWRQQFGHVYGMFEGSVPSIMIADPDVLRQVCIKDFDVFTNHHAALRMNELQKNFIFVLQDDKWKRVRSMLSPTFTSGKMRRMYKLMDRCVDDLVQVMEEQFDSKTADGTTAATATKTTTTPTTPSGAQPADDCGPVINVKSIFSLYTMDAIASCCYGIKLDRQKSSDLETVANRNEFVASAMKLFEFKIWRILLIMSLSKRLIEYFDLNMIPDSNIMPFAKRIERFIEKRESNKTIKFDDYLQILLDEKNAGRFGRASLGDGAELADGNELDSVEAHHAGIESNGNIDQTNKSESGQQQRPLEDIVVLSNAAFLLTVGLETTATLLANCSYALAFHEHVQDKLLEAVKPIAMVKENGAGKSSYTFEYDSLIACHYLDSVLSETLRALTPVLQTDRVARRDYVIEKYDVCVPAGTKVVINLQDIMMNSEYWPEPEKFDPDRFEPENRDKIVPGAYCPFGLGPRHCLGMRFSLTEAKFALATLIMLYRFKPAPGTKYPPENTRNLGLGNLKKPLVKLVRRN